MEEASRLRARFLAIASHDIRSPIAAILGMTELLLDGVLGRLSPEQQSAIQDIDRGGRYLNDVIENVLDLARIEAGTMALDLEDVNVLDAVSNVLELLGPQAREKGIVLETVVPRDMAALNADATALRRILYNLVSNSLKFTKKGRITVTVEDQPDQVVFTVSDTGQGIQPEALNWIFEEYRQESASTRRTHGGTGLGLAICKSLVSLHGGMIGVDSTPGSGSTFRFSLPRLPGA
jgi:signal transduction histidine kinase